MASRSARGILRHLERLQVGQPKLAETFLADMKHVSAAQDARQSLFDVLKCTALKNHMSSKIVADRV